MKKKTMQRNILTGVLASCIASVFFILILSLIMMFKDLNSRTFEIMWGVLTSVSIIIGAIKATKRNGEKGWLVGLSVGIGYFIIIELIAIVVNGASFSGINVVMLLTSMGIGTLSGMLGINI